MDFFSNILKWLSREFLGTPGSAPAPGTQGPTLPASKGAFGTGGEFSWGQTLATAKEALPGVVNYLDYQADMKQADFLSDQARQRAEAARISGEAEIAQTRKLQRAALAKQMAAVGKSGAEMSGGLLNLTTQTAAEQELDILYKKYNVASGAADIFNEGVLKSSAARSSGRSKLLKSAGNILGGY